MLLTLALLFTPPALAADDGWEIFSSRCETELRDEWLPEIQKGKDWTKHSLENLRGLKDMSLRICPAYLAKRNDGAAIAAFVSAKKKILDESPVVDKEGNRLTEFLRVQFEEHKAAFAPAEIDFGTSRCGLHMQSTSKKMKARLLEIKDTLQALTKKCFGVNTEQERAAQEEHLKKAGDTAGHGQGAGTPSGQGTKPGASDITGVPEKP